MTNEQLGAINQEKITILERFQSCITRELSDIIYSEEGENSSPDFFAIKVAAELLLKLDFLDGRKQ